MENQVNPRSVIGHVVPNALLFGMRTVIYEGRRLVMWGCREPGLIDTAGAIHSARVVHGRVQVYVFGGCLINEKAPPTQKPVN